MSGDEEATLTQSLLPDSLGHNLTGKQVASEAKKRKNVVARATESLDYEPVQNRLYYERLHAMEPAARKFYGYTGHTVFKNGITILAGALTGAVAVGLILCTRALRGWKDGMVQHMIDTYSESGNGILAAFGFHWAYSTALVLFAGCLVQFWAPAAAGAGVSLVMAYLNGNHVPNLLRWRTLVTKFIGTVCGCASSLAMGPEGPMVHLGACTASVLSHANPWGNAFCSSSRPGKEAKKGSVCEVLEDLGTDQDHREFISAGTAAGLSAAFGAPIGGVLFSMEEACSHWSRRLMWRCFLAAVVAAFVLAQYNDFAHHLEEGGEDPSKRTSIYRIHESMLAFDGIKPVSGIAWLRQAPFMVFVSLGAGLLGALFNLFRKWLWNVRASRSRPLLRLLELVALAAVSVGTMFYLSAKFGKCEERNPMWIESYGMDWTCNSGPGTARSHNDLATMFLSSPEETIRAFFSVGVAPDGTETRSYFSQSNLALYCCTYIILMALGSGLAVPGGLFMPAIMVGSSFGLFVGNEIEAATPDEWEVQPGLYALIAATACLGGVFRSSISLVVIVVEGTRGIDYIFGVIIAVVCSNWVAHLIHHDGVYESEVERDGNLCFLRPEPPHALHTKRASQVMSASVVGVRGVESVRRVLHILRNCHHNGFPVVSRDVGDLGAIGALRPGDSSDEVGRLDGLVLRSQLMVLLQERVFCDCNGRPLNDDEAGPDAQQRIEREMRMYFQRNFQNHRSMATQQGLQQIALALVSPPSLSPNGTPTTDGRGSNSGSMVSSIASVYERRPDGTEALRPEAAYRSRFAAVAALAHTPIGSDDVEASLENGIEAVLPAGCPDLDAPEFQAAIRGLYIDVRPYMNHAPLTVHAMTAASRVHELFLALGMRHLCVVNSRNSVVGIITRKDLDRAAGHGSWRHNRMPTIVRDSLALGMRSMSRIFSKQHLPVSNSGSLASHPPAPASNS